jgi:hypothetical protein
LIECSLEASCKNIADNFIDQVRIFIFDNFIGITNSCGLILLKMVLLVLKRRSLIESPISYPETKKYYIDSDLPKHFSFSTFFNIFKDSRE